MTASRLRSHPVAAGLGFLAFLTIVFPPLHGRLGDGAFVICNLIPLGFAAIFGMRRAIVYVVAHVAWGMVLAFLAGESFDRFVSNGIPASLATLIAAAGIGRIRDLTTRLQRELEERRRAESALRQHKEGLEALIQERTDELLQSNQRLRQEMAERERAEADKRQLQASLKRAEKMEAIGVLAGSVAHDLNNILSGIITYPELMLLELPEDSPMRESLIGIQTSGERAAAVVEDLLTMARRGLTTRRVLSLNEIVTELTDSAELADLSSRNPGVRVETALDPQLLNVQGSAVHLTKAVLNLVVNAMEALEDGGKLTLATANVYVDKPTGGYEVLSEGEYVTLSVQDTGEGISRQDLDRIFEPFYSRKVMGRSGTGLGMAIVWGTVKDHGGFIDVQSEEGRGTTFTLFLPATRKPLQAELSEIRLEENRGDGETILVVDDVEVQRDLCQAILTKLGYSVATVAGGEEAIEHVRQQPVDLLILDMIMDPGIDGLATYERILEIRPGQKAIIASGFSESERVKAAQKLGAGAYIRKPYSLQKLAVTVREELQRGR